MILYFTGTGNSKFVAGKTADILKDTAVDIFDRIKTKNTDALESVKPWVVVTPTYAWQIPHIVRDHLAATELKGNKKIYFIMTCGDDIGNAEKYAKKLCDKKGMEFMGCIPVVMPENYIAMFDTPCEEKAAHIIEKALPSIKKTAEIIKEEKKYSQKINIQDKLKSSVVNTLFCSFFVKDKKFTVSESCINCGVCAAKCPCGNITFRDKKPVWNGNCVHCMACISYCPKEAIEYGKISVGQQRYKISSVKKYNDNMEKEN